MMNCVLKKANNFVIISQWVPFMLHVYKNQFIRQTFFFVNFLLFIFKYEIFLFVNFEHGSRFQRRH